MDFFYTGQIRRYLVQFMRIFSDIKVRNGPDVNGLYSLQSVPIVYGNPSWLVAQTIKGASENTMLPVPMFSAYITDIKTSSERRQDTQFVGKVSTIEREFDYQAGAYTNKPGIRQDVERYMPVPYDLSITLDVWTTNITNKLQIMEQICTIFNPSIQLQQNTNILDWTSIFEVWLEDITWSSQSVPQGSEELKDIMSFNFKIPIWINPPAKVKRSTIITEIVTNVFATTNDIKEYDNLNIYDSTSLFSISSNPSQIITTDGNYCVNVYRGRDGDEVELLNQFGATNPTTNWAELIKKYGSIVKDVSKMRLKLDPDIDVDSSDIIGFIEIDSTRPNILKFTPDQDTLPPNTLSAIQSIIDPIEVSPGNGLPNSAVGQRYLITSSTSAGEEPAIPPGVPTSPWGEYLEVYPNDIIEYTGSEWVKVFDSRSAKSINRVINLSDMCQYTFENGVWSYTYYGKYSPGYWRIDNINQPLRYE